jgi:hypothetical protein
MAIPGSAAIGDGLITGSGGVDLPLTELVWIAD